MFAIGIRYLCGWAMATHPTDRTRPEWPPHPDRVFMALAAAHFEGGGAAEEQAALAVLSSSAAGPALSASGHRPRQTVTTFVPVNDDSSPIGKKGGAMMPSGSMPIGRDRQPRSFPVAIPDCDTVYLIWPELEVDGPTRSALSRLCRGVSAIGHSSSLVQMWVEDNPPQPNLLPIDRPSAPMRLRVPWPGRLAELRARYDADLRPTPAGWKGYAERPELREVPAAGGTVFAPEIVVLRFLEGRRVGLESALLLTEALRCAAMKHCPGAPPEWVSGHAGPEGPPSRRPHIAFLPLAHVGREHADGHLLGMGLAIPRAVSDDEQRDCLGPLLFDENGLTRTIRLTLGSLGAWTAAVDEREDRPWTLRPETWTGGLPCGGDTWATAAPIVLDQYPKGRDRASRANRIEEIIASSCTRILEPGPAAQQVSVRKVIATPSPFFSGVPHSREFPPFRSGPTLAKRFHTHALIVFSEPVVGPILIGAGRYRGYGLCKPWREAAR